MKMRWYKGAPILALAVLAAFLFQAQAGAQGTGGARPSGPVVTGKVYKIEKDCRPSVLHHIG